MHNPQKVHEDPAKIEFNSCNSLSLVQSRHNSEDFDLFTLDDVDSAFDLVKQLKYSQTVQLKGTTVLLYFASKCYHIFTAAAAAAAAGKGHGLTITPFPAGHMVGGTIWKIVKDGEEEIVYAIDFNHKKERSASSKNIEHIRHQKIHNYFTKTVVFLS